MNNKKEYSSPEFQIVECVSSTRIAGLDLPDESILDMADDGNAE